MRTKMDFFKWEINCNEKMNVRANLYVIDYYWEILYSPRWQAQDAGNLKDSMAKGKYCL